MALDVVDLRTFYASPLGHVARRVVGKVVLKLWPDCRRQRLLGLGFATPYLPILGGEAERVIAFMPAAQGVVNRVVKAGIRAILNFAPTKLDVPPDVALKNVNMALELEGLSYALANGARKARRAES